MAKLKVFGITLMKPHHVQLPGRQIDCVIAAPSQKVAAEALRTTLGNLRTFGSVTGNQKAIVAAMSKPGAVFAKALDDYHGNYIEIQP